MTTLEAINTVGPFIVPVAAGLWAAEGQRTLPLGAMAFLLVCGFGELLAVWMINA